MPADQELPPDSALEVVVVPRTHDLGDNFEVRRALPSRQKRMIGPFVFLDQMGPHVFSLGQGLDVRPHPHIGLATVTYLFSGEILHRDSLGSVQSILPGDVNWMTAGSGIVHSERTAEQTRQHESSLFGLQCWVALPRAQEERAPDFRHTGIADLPVEEGEGVTARVIAGASHGVTGAMRRDATEPLYLDLHFKDAGSFAQSLPAGHNAFVYVYRGSVIIGDAEVTQKRMAILRNDAEADGVRLQAAGPARVLLIAGRPLGEPIAQYGPFVMNTNQEIFQAVEDFRAGRF